MKGNEVAKKIFGPVTTAHQWVQLDDHTRQTYNFADTVNTARVRLAQEEEMKHTGHYDYFTTQYWPMVEAVMAMAERGLAVDKTAHLEYSAAIRNEQAALERSLKARCGYDINLNAPQQKATWLFDELGLKSLKETESGLRSVDQDALVRTLRAFRRRDEPHRSIIEDLFHRSKLQQISSHYLNLEIGEDGRVRPQIKMYRAETGRLAYTDPPLQQWPHKARHVWCAAPGHVYVSADYKQLEARILAYLANDRASIEVFERDGDIHQQNAMDLFAITEVQWDGKGKVERKATRDFAKGFLYGISYGGEAETMKTKEFCPCPRCVDETPPTLSLRREEIRNAQLRWNAKHPAVLTWRRELLTSVVGPNGTHSYTTPTGRKRFFFTPWPKVEREIYNCPMQTTAATIVDGAMVILHEMGAPIVLQHHDSLTLEVREEEAPRWARMLKQTMELPIIELGGVSFPVDLTMGKNWRDLDDIPPSFLTD